MRTLLVNTMLLLGALAGLGQTEIPPPSSASTSAAVVPAELSGPKIQFAETLFDFGKINAGEVVRHDFVLTNVGKATLEIKDVRAGCGCTTAGTWDRHIEPGQTGVVPLQFNSGTFSGSVAKSATVTCNDPGQSNVTLQIKATVWRPIDVTPPMVVFSVSGELSTNQSRTVRILSNLEEPVELSEPQCTNRSFRTELKTLQAGKEFELRITAVPPFASPSVTAPVTVKTSSAKHPTINVSAYLTVQQPVTVAPNHVMLPAGPLTNAMRPAITIRNTGTNALVLSEPRVNVPGPEVHLKELQPGRVFNVTIDFPAGFQAQLGQNVEVTVKSDHPKFPLIKVPVIQLQPPAASFQRQPSVAPSATRGALSPLRLVPGKQAPPEARKN